MRRSSLAGLAALIVALAGAGAYIGARHLMDSRGAAALDRLVQRLPPGTELAYGRLNVTLPYGTVTLDRVTLDNGVQRWTARRARLAEGGLRAREVRVAGADGLRARAGRLDVTWGDAGLGLGLARVTAEDLRVQTPKVRLASPRVTARTVTPARLGRVRSPKLSLTPRNGSGGARAGEGTTLQVRGLALTGARPGDLTRLAELPRRAPYHWPAALAMLELDRLEARSLRLGSGSWLRLEGLDLERRPGAAPGTRAWRVAASRFDLALPAAQPWSALAAPETPGRLRGGLALTLRLRPAADRLDLADLALDLDVGAAVAGTLTLGALPAPESAGGLGLYLNRTRLERLDLTVTDRGLRARLLAGWAARAGEDRAALAARLDRALARRRAQADTRFRASLDALAAFLDEGGRLRLAATPQPPPTLARLAVELGRRPLHLARDALRVER